MTKIEELREKANRLPLLPGVYIMLDASGEVIYVGKAKALKNRVTSYFRGDHLPKVAAMVSHVNDFNVIIAETEFEALVLENSLIKRHKPHYNILLKDDKGYPFLRLDRREPYPRFTLSNRANPDGAKYFGPYGGRGQTMSIIDTLCKTLGLPTCRRVFPRDIGKDRPCLQYQMGACRGWCRGEPGGEEYRRAIGEAVDILEGRSAELVRRIETEMNAAAEDLRFEEAGRLRDRMRAVSTLENRQRVIAAARADTDAVGFVRGAKSCFSVLHYTNGDLSGKDVSLIDDPTETDGEALSTLLLNKIRGVLNVACVKAPGYGDRRKEMLKDIAILTGGEVITGDLDMDLKDTTFDQLGKAHQVKITKDDTTIVGGAGDPAAIQARISEIKSLISTTESEYDKEKYNERLAKLSGGVAVIKVGAQTETEMHEMKLRIEDALNATRAAVEEGIVAGGGTAYVNAIPAVAKLVATLEGDEKTGAQIVAKALEAPVRQIAYNAGVDGSVIFDRISNSGKVGYGYNAYTEEYCDMIGTGIVDPTKVTRTALENAASIASCVLTTESLVADKPDPQQDAAIAAAQASAAAGQGMY